LARQLYPWGNISLYESNTRQIGWLGPGAVCNYLLPRFVIEATYSVVQPAAYTVRPCRSTLIMELKLR